GGPITGKRADLFIIDDPVESHEEAESAGHAVFSAVLQLPAIDRARAGPRSRLTAACATALCAVRSEASPIPKAACQRESAPRLRTRRPQKSASCCCGWPG